MIELRLLFEQGLAAQRAGNLAQAKQLYRQILRSDAAHFAAINKVYARYFPVDPPARSFICVLPWHGPFDVEIDCFARA